MHLDDRFEVVHLQVDFLRQLETLRGVGFAEERSSHLQCLRIRFLQGPHHLDQLLEEAVLTDQLDRFHRFAARQVHLSRRSGVICFAVRSLFAN